MATAITTYDATGVRHMMGTYTSTSTTATIVTGLNYIVCFNLQSTGSATSPHGSVSGGTITATTANADSGYWEAWGN